MSQEKTDSKRPKVRIDARVDADIWDKIEELVKETGETKSKVINDLLADKFERAASSNYELSRLEKELEAKNKQIDSFLRQKEEDLQIIKNKQEIALYDKQIELKQLENEGQTSKIEQPIIEQAVIKQAVNEAIDESIKEKEENKRGWFNWFK